ncbi:hypothetical protein CR194_13765 [Salipaludibacillus keqinensis]|uniref:Uncharacterized protein n=1 Tax=Salipaludibacillus keqinensis TaxID=2045207 RepID=A0A323TC38_9BACI|nr:hypothetical protein [Salipaludibacillus keqinensis]PYZ92718.1 hypothetical protein CR194_13765 [Salipaludibacillus keqinensis]
MSGLMRHYLKNIAKVPSFHYIYLSSYPVTKVDEMKEMNILPLIQSPVIFVMRGPICLKGLTELLSQGTGVVFDYEKTKYEEAIRLAVLQQNSYVSPGVKRFIQPELDLYIKNEQTLFYKMDKSITTSPTTKSTNKTILNLIVDKYTKKQRSFGCIGPVKRC